MRILRESAITRSFVCHITFLITQHSSAHYIHILIMYIMHIVISIIIIIIISLSFISSGVVVAKPPDQVSLAT